MQKKKLTQKFALDMVPICLTTKIALDEEERANLVVVVSMVGLSRFTDAIVLQLVIARRSALGSVRFVSAVNPIAGPTFKFTGIQFTVTTVIPLPQMPEIQKKSVDLTLMLQLLFRPS